MKQTRWDAAVDPDGVLPERERIARADALRAAFYVRQGLNARHRRRLADGSSTSDQSVDQRSILGRRALDRAEERRLAGRMGGFIKRSRHDPREGTGAARAAFDRRFEAQVDADGLLSAAERRRRADAAQRAFYARLALASIDARERKARRVGRLSSEQAERYAATRRALTGRIGAYTRAASQDPIELTRRARIGWEQWFTNRLDLDSTLDADRRAALVQAAKSQYFRELAAKRQRGKATGGVEPRGGDDVRRCSNCD